MMYNEIYKTVMQSYNGDNQITIGMREDFIHIFNECFGDKVNDEYYKITMSMLLTKAMQARSFKGFEKAVKIMVDCVQYPIELSNLVQEVKSWQRGERKTCPIK